MDLVNLRRHGLEDFQKDRLLFFSYVFCILSVILQALILLVSFGKLPPQVPLFYSRPWGEQILAPPIFLAILPAIAFLTLVLNHFVNLIFAKGDIFLSRVLIWTTSIVGIVTLYNTLKIVSLLI